MKPIRQPVRRVLAAGFSLIELMVAITIGLFISAALGAVFLNTKSTFTAQDGLAQLQDNQRLATMLLTQSLQLAGYFPTPDQVLKAQQLQSGSYGGYSFLAQAGVTGATVGSSDVLATRYSIIAADGQTSCLGDAPATATPAWYVNVFSIGAGNVLQCQVTTSAGTGAAQALVSNVSSFSVLYGVPVDASGAVVSGNSVTQYFPAATVTTKGYWPSVKTAQVTINFINPYAGQAGQPATLPWTVTVSLMNGNTQ